MLRNYSLLPSLENSDTHDALFVLADVWASQDPEAATVLLRLLREDDLLVRVETLQALGRLKAARARPMIQVFRQINLNVFPKPIAKLHYYE